MTDISAAFSMSQLAKLAQSNNPQKRDQLFLALGSLCAFKPMENPAEGSAFGEIMFLLNKNAAETIRQQTSNLLCSKQWAPRRLILEWANDVIPVASPVLLKSPILTEEDLIEIAQNTGIPHRITIASRSQINEQVTGALIVFNEPDVLIAMTNNQSAQMNMESFASCVRISRRHGKIRLNLANRNDLPRSLIPSLFAYSGEEERKIIAKKFSVDVDNFSSVVRQAVMKKAAPNTSDHSPKTKELDAARLVSKLARAEKLTPATVVKAATEEKIYVFEHALSQLAGVPAEQFRLAISRSPSMALALACQAAQLEKAVFPSLHRSLLNHGYIQEKLCSDVASKSAQAFSSHSPAAAAVALRLLARAA